MAVAALLFNLLKINYDLFFDNSPYKTRMIVSVILTFLTFVFYTVFYGMTAQRYWDNQGDQAVHEYWFGWIAMVFHFASFVVSFFIPKNGDKYKVNEI